MKSKTCFLIENPIDLFYLTGLKISSGSLLITEDDSQLFVDGRYLEMVRQANLLSVVLDTEEEKRKFIKNHRIHRIIFDSAKTNCEHFALLRKIFRIPLQPRPRILQKVRMVKTPEEVAKMKKSAKLNYSGYRYLLKQLKSGITERELSLLFQIFCLKHGADGAAFEPIVAFGKNSSLPHHHSGSTRLKKGDIVLLDLGVQLEGYASDMTRVHFFGSPDPKLEKLYRIVRLAQKAALALCTPGQKIGELDAAARREMAKEGVEELFVHSLGHGIGLEVHEFPRIKQDGVDRLLPLEPGMAITIEPGLYLPNKGGVRYEDTILITSTGHLNLYPEEK